MPTLCAIINDFEADSDCFGTGATPITIGIRALPNIIVVRAVRYLIARRHLFDKVSVTVYFPCLCHMCCCIEQLSPAFGAFVFWHFQHLPF